MAIGYLTGLSVQLKTVGAIMIGLELGKYTFGSQQDEASESVEIHGEESEAASASHSSVPRMSRALSLESGSIMNNSAKEGRALADTLLDSDVIEVED